MDRSDVVDRPLRQRADRAAQRVAEWGEFVIDLRGDAGGDLARHQPFAFEPAQDREPNEKGRLAGRPFRIRMARGLTSWSCSTRRSAC